MITIVFLAQRYKDTCKDVQTCKASDNSFLYSSVSKKSDYKNFPIVVKNALLYVSS